MVNKSGNRDFLGRMVMKQSSQFRRRKWSILLMVAVLVMAIVVPAYSISSEPAFQITSINIPGLAGTENNFQFAYERFALLAPYAQSQTVTEDTRLADLDNHYLYVIDSKKLKNPLRADLGNCYYPTRAYFEPNSQ